MAANFNLAYGKTLVLRVTLNDQNGNQIQGPVTWTTDDASATYSTMVPGNSLGYSNHYCCAVTAKSTAGTVNITATSGSVTATYQIAVYTPVVTTATIGLN